MAEVVIAGGSRSRATEYGGRAGARPSRAKAPFAKLGNDIFGQSLNHIVCYRGNRKSTSDS